MAKYRNITHETLAVDLGQFGLVTVEPEGVFEVSASYPNYIQTGETGEPALFELVDTTTKKAAAAPAKKED